MVDVSSRMEPREFVLPARPPRSFVADVAARVVGPGRRERLYLARLAELEAALTSRSHELEASARLERGCQRLIDRLEHHIDADRAQVEQLQQQQKQLILALGGAQREVELLRERLLLATASPKQLPAPRAGWFARWLGRR